MLFLRGTGRLARAFFIRTDWCKFVGNSSRPTTRERLPKEPQPLRAIFPDSGTLCP
jgi:hypothetical protein